ncbi:MAG TPA: YhdP family protein [Methylococcus sp.]|nr:YhdP family protein [Methylococcus sp.]
MKRILRVSFRATRHTFLAALFGLAVVSIVLRLWILPQVAVFKSRLENQIGDLAQENVRIGRVSARMWGARPELVLEDFAILDETGGQAIRFREVRVAIAPLESFRHGEFRLAWLQFRGAHLSLRRDPDGRVELVGLHRVEHPPAWLNTAGYVQIVDCTVDWLDLRRGSKTIALGTVELLLTNEGTRHRLGVRLVPPSTLAAEFRAAAEAEGDLFRPETLSGRAYAEARQLALGAWGVRLSPVFAIPGGQADFQVWGDLRRGAVERLAIRTDLRRLRLEWTSAEGAMHGVDMDRVAGDLNWMRQGRAWSLNASRMRISSSGRAWPMTRFGLRVDRDADGTLRFLSGQADALALADFETVLRIPLGGTAPQGVVSGLRFLYEGTDPSPHLALCADFNGLALPSHAGLPGFSGGSGRLCGSDRAGTLRIVMEEGMLNLPEVLSESIRILHGELDLEWLQEGDHWSVQSRTLRVQTQDFAVAGAIQVHRTGSDRRGPRVDFGAELGPVAAASVHRYFPMRLYPALGGWLKQALHGGRLERGSVRLQGHLADFPFREGNGVFEAWGEFSDVELHFQPEWPVLRQAGGTIRFAGAGMKIEANAGQIGEGMIHEVRASIPDLTRGEGIRIEGRASASLAQGLAFLHASPLRRIAEHLDAVTQVSGDCTVDLALRIPLEPGRGLPSVDGKIQLRKASLTFDGLAQPLQNIDGVLLISERGIAARNIRASWLGQPVSANLREVGEAIEVAASGKFPIAVLKDRFPSPVWKYLGGTLPLTVTATFPRDQKSGDFVDVKVNSNLSGTRVALPEPFAKPAELRRSLRLTTRLAREPRHSIAFSYGEETSGILDLTADTSGFRLHSGRVAVGLSAQRLAGPDLPLASDDGPGLRVAVRLPSLELAPWLDFRAENEVPAGFELASLDLYIGQVFWRGWAKGPLQVQLRAKPGGYRGSLDSDRAKGEFEVEIEDGALSKIRSDLDFLKVPVLAEKPDATSLAPGSVASCPEFLSPHRLPALTLASRHVLWHGFDLGRLDLRVERQGTGVVLRSAVLRSDNHVLTVSEGEWMRQGQMDSTRLSGTIRVKDSGMLATQLGYAGVVRETPAEITYRLTWPDSPLCARAPKLSGEVEMNYGAGALLKVDVGIGRFLGLFNVGSIWRRLSLDFSDLFGEGMAYDRVSGKFRILQGRAETHGLLIDGVAAKILINGRIGLADGEVDQVVTVIPNTSIALPVAGVLAGGPLGPAVGAAAFLANKMLGGQVERVVQTHYLVRGNWENPVITRVHGNMPLDWVDRAWTGVKNISGFSEEKGRE